MNASSLVKLNTLQQIDIAFNLPLLSANGNDELATQWLISCGIAHAQGETMEHIMSRYQYVPEYRRPDPEKILKVSQHVLRLFGYHPHALFIMESIAFFSYLRVRDNDSIDTFKSTHPQYWETVNEY